METAPVPQMSMNTLLDFKLRDFIDKSISHLFSTMLKMRLTPQDPEKEVKFDGEKIVGTVNLVGMIAGVLHVYVSVKHARLMTGSLLGVRSDQIRNLSNLDDAVGELANMLGGNLKSKLCDLGLACVLSIPSVTRGTDFQIQLPEGMVNERFVYTWQQQVICLEVSLRPTA
jgi:CheY-specific phosphatase CheX